MLEVVSTCGDSTWCKKPTRCLFGFSFPWERFFRNGKLLSEHFQSPNIQFQNALQSRSLLAGSSPKTTSRLLANQGHSFYLGDSSSKLFLESNRSASPRFTHFVMTVLNSAFRRKYYIHHGRKYSSPSR